MEQINANARWKIQRVAGLKCQTRTNPASAGTEMVTNNIAKRPRLVSAERTAGGLDFSTLAMKLEFAHVSLLPGTAPIWIFQIGAIYPRMEWGSLSLLTQDQARAFAEPPASFSDLRTAIM